MKQPLFLAAMVMGTAYMVAAPRSAAPPSPMPAPGQTAPAKSAFAEEGLVLERDSGGQFHLTGEIDGQDTQFLIDTGADTVAITVDEAERLGLDVDPSSFEPITKTASGVGMGAVVELDRLEVAGSEFRGIEAIVIEGLEVNLLGQTVLRQLGQVSLQGDRMVIRR